MKLFQLCATIKICRMREFRSYPGVGNLRGAGGVAAPMGEHIGATSVPTCVQGAGLHSFTVLSAS